MALTAYGHTNKGEGLWYTPYTPSPNGCARRCRSARPNTTSSRSGEIANFDVDLGSQHGQVRRSGTKTTTSTRPAASTPSPRPPSFPSPYDFLSNPFFTQWQYKFKTTTNQYWLSDDWAVTDALTVTAGFKGLHVTTDGTAVVIGASAGTNPVRHRARRRRTSCRRSARTSSCRATDELFTSYSRNMRAFQGAATGTTPFATTDRRLRRDQGHAQARDLG